ncbi:hypothetical protein BH24PSE2_BH24PSE2_19550 [soil metagenome]
MRRSARRARQRAPSRVRVTSRLGVRIKVRMVADTSPPATKDASWVHHCEVGPPIAPSLQNLFERYKTQRIDRQPAARVARPLPTSACRFRSISSRLARSTASPKPDRAAARRHCNNGPCGRAFRRSRAGGGAVREIQQRQESGADSMLRLTAVECCGKRLAAAVGESGIPCDRACRPGGRRCSRRDHGWRAMRYISERYISGRYISGPVCSICERPGRLCECNNGALNLNETKIFR